MEKNINQNHYGVGDNIAGDKNNYQDKKDKKINWINIIAATATVLGLFWAIYIYYKPHF